MNAYRDYLNMIGSQNVKLPQSRREEKLPFISLESELDAIIAHAMMKTCAFLRFLKDTGIRPIEAWRLKWMDIDTSTKCATITPSKSSGKSVVAQDRDRQHSNCSSIARMIGEVFKL